MRSAQMTTGAGNGRRRPEAGPEPAASRRSRPGSRNERGRAGAAHKGRRLHGLRWVPVPLAVLAAVLGLLVVGSLQGQAAAQRARDGYQAGGLALSVGTMLWMSNDMTGMGPVKNKNPNGFAMPSSMMPGMQAGGHNRLRVEVSLRNVTSDVQRYSLDDFSMAAPGGKSWRVSNSERSDLARSASLEPGFGMTIDLYFDIPASKSHGLTLEWSRNGSTVSIPVNTNGTNPGSMRM